MITARTSRRRSTGSLVTQAQPSDSRVGEIGIAVTTQMKTI